MSDSEAAPEAMPMVDRRHHSIGEVLSLLKEEHQDITISKIRFLESQGLISPERTPSGYRKFYDDDIDRLRWILSQQRDNFLPLKVIKSRMAEEDFDPTADLPDLPERPLGALPEPTLFNRSGAADATSDSATAQGAAQTSALIGSVSMTAGELADAVGSDLGFIGELDRLGLIAALKTDAGSAFDDEAVIVARAAVGLQSRGFDVRHLRMFKLSADRESGILQQLAAPGIHRGGSARQDAFDDVTEMVRLGEILRRAVIRRNLGAPFDG